MSILTLIIIGVVIIAISSLLALVHAIRRAEEGYEDSTGYHPLMPGDETSQVVREAIRGGSACPWDFKPALHSHNHFSPGQT